MFSEFIFKCIRSSHPRFPAQVGGNCLQQLADVVVVVYAAGRRMAMAAVVGDYFAPPHSFEPDSHRRRLRCDDEGRSSSSSLGRCDSKSIRIFQTGANRIPRRFSSSRSLCVERARSIVCLPNLNNLSRFIYTSKRMAGRRHGWIEFSSPNGAY